MLGLIRTLRWSAAAALALPIAVAAPPSPAPVSRALIAAYSTAMPRGHSPYASTRRVFDNAYDLVETGHGHGESGANDPASLKHYPLYPYLQAARIEQALLGAPNSEVPADHQAAALLTHHEGEPVALELRRAWLASLAQRQQWAQFLSAYRSQVATPVLRCRRFAARIALGRTTGLARAIEAAWLTPQSMPECRTAFVWLQRHGALSAQLIAKRARLALEASNPAFAREIIAQLPQGRVATELRLWAALLEHPMREIDALLATPHRPVDPKALLAGWSVLARRHPKAAEARYWRLVVTRHLTYAQASPYALALALGLAWDRDPVALKFFRRVEPHDFDDAARKWHIRAALWSQRWTVALHGIEALPRSERRTSRWRYWAARAEAALHHRARARRVYETLLKDDDYYSALASARLRRRVEPHPRAVPVNSTVLALLDRIPAIVRARELYFCGLEHYADAEWRYAYRTLNAQERLQSIHLAARWGWFTQAIETAADQHVFDDYALLYPRPFRIVIHTAAKRAQLAPALIFGVIRQESLYQIDAVSPAGALGLMQLMPQTATRTAHFWGMADPDRTDLFIPAINIAIGTEHLRTLLNRFGGRIPLALAGYNAGTRAVLRWLPAKPVPGDIWIENIPYNETRAYVERILWHSLLFRWLRHGVTPSPRSWLAPVGRSLLAKPLESRTDHIGDGGRRLS